MPEEPIAHWRSGDVEYGVALLASNGEWLVLVAATGPGGDQRTGHARRPRHVGSQERLIVEWTTATDRVRTAAAERILAERG